jgi:hypothetical protein
VDVGDLIASIDGRSEADAERLLAGLVGHFWPGGSQDVHRPGAAEWVRRWGPALDRRVPRGHSPN